MRTRPAQLAAVAAVLLVLSGCGAGTSEPSASPTSETGTPAELKLPEDALLGLVGILTAPNGATADIAVVVHASLPWMVDGAADAVAATEAWCAGEVDDTVISGRGYTFTQVDVSVTPRDGDWPDDVSLLVLPVANPEVGSTIVAADGLRQVDEDVEGFYTDAVPHCRQPALLDGAGDGSLYLGVPEDIAGVNGLESFTAWTLHDFGLSAVLPGDLGESAVTFSACASALTPLGEEFGAPNDSWSESFTSSSCTVGGSGTR